MAQIDLIYAFLNALFLCALAAMGLAVYRLDTRFRAFVNRYWAWSVPATLLIVVVGYWGWRVDLSQKQVDHQVAVERMDAVRALEKVALPEMEGDHRRARLDDALRNMILLQEAAASFGDEPRGVVTSRGAYSITRVKTPTGIAVEVRRLK